MVKTKLNIPAVLVHDIKGTQYKVNGILLAINESNDTCTMKFDGNLVESNIPMNKILINEGFLDKVKEYGKKVASYITSKVKGFIALVDEATGKVFPWSMCNVANLAIKAAKGDMPDGVFFAPSPSLQKIAGVKGMTIDQAFAAAESIEREQIINYWTRVIKRTGTTPKESIEESIKYVNETYYKESKMYKKLNEVVYSYDDVKMGAKNGGAGQYGVPVSSKQLKAKLKTNILNQISGPLGGHADVVPFLIWGAPGIGKTAIIKSTIKDMAQSKWNAINLNLEIISLSGYTIEQWTLPSGYIRNIAGIEIDRFADKPKIWLPVYLRSSDPEENARRDDFCNTCKFLATNQEGHITSADGHPFEGGIVFMDEYSRVEPNVQNILMALGNEHTFGDNYQVASKWGFVFASNRSFDENDAETDDLRYFPTAAQMNRFKHFTYVPSKKEWIEWAREVNPITHEANVPPFITDFIEATKDFVWYSTIVNGGYDDLLENPEANKRAHEHDESEVQAVLDQPLLKTKRVVTPRTWANTIGPEYKMELIRIFDGNKEGMTGEEYYQKLIDDSIIEKTDEEGNSYKEYYGGILPNILVDALNDVDDERWEEWVEDKGGEEYLDPSGSFTGIRGRYNMFMQWFLENVRDSIGDGSGTSAYNSTSPVMQQWKAYQSYAKHFTPDVYISIWETGKKPKEYQKDDDKTPVSIDKFADTEFSKWKQVSSICFDVAKGLFDAYPGNLADDVEHDIQNMANAKPIKPEDITIEAEKLIDEYSFMLNNKKVNLLFDAKDLADQETLANKIFSLKNSVVARRFAHFAQWISKVAIQAENGHLASDYENKLYKTLRELDTDLQRQFNNYSAISKLRPAVTKNPKDKVLKRQYDIEESKIPILPAVIMLHRAKSYDFNNIRARNK